MRINISKNSDPTGDSIQMSRSDIEKAVIDNLAKFRKEYMSRFGKHPQDPLDVEMLVELLWGFTVIFDEIKQDDPENETLGELRPELKQVAIHTGISNQKRISFTIAHEAGHLSLHRTLFKIQDKEIIGWANGAVRAKSKRQLGAEARREWQANFYAGTLLAPRLAIDEFLLNHGLVNGTPFDLETHWPNFDSNFGLSRQALEIRLDYLGIPFINRRYPTN